MASGYRQRVRDVLVWSGAPFVFRNELMAADGLNEPRPAHSDEVKHLGDHPTVTRVTIGKATVEVAAHRDDIELLLVPYRTTIIADAAALAIRIGSAARSEGL